MTEDEMNRKMEFIVEQQAQFTADIQVLKERQEAFQTLCERLGQDGAAVTQLLWDAYDPWIVWLPIAAIGVTSIVGLYLFARAARKWADMNH